MRVTVRPDLVSLEDFDAAMEAAQPRQGMSLPTLQQRYADLADLYRRRASFWAAQVAAAEEGAQAVPPALVEAARLCAAHDRLQARRWVAHGEEVAKQR
jgi:hypothetical protein